MAVLNRGLYMVMLLTICTHVGHTLDTNGYNDGNSTSTTVRSSVHLMVNNVNVSISASTASTANTTATTTTTTTTLPDMCRDVLCEHGGMCRYGECTCQSGFTGDRCQTAICSESYLEPPVNGQKSCSKQPQSLSDITCDLTCLHGHYFADRQRTHVYDCTDGLWLPSEIDVANCYRIDYCLNVTCQNNGTCVESWRDATCSCPSGFSGDSCQIDEDECISAPCHNGGQCIDGRNDFLCRCPPSYGGPYCQTAILRRPVLTGVFPEYGPQAGGTLITVTGEHLVVPIRNILLYLSDLKISAEQIPKKLCRVVISNSTHIVAVTPSAGEDLIRRYLPMAVELTGGVVYSSQLYFQYKPNPHISAIEPTDTIMAGGTSMTIMGQSLDSVAIPVLRVIMVATWRIFTEQGQIAENKTTIIFQHPCEVSSVVNKTRRICRTPSVHVPEELNMNNISDSTSRQARDLTTTNQAHHIRHGSRRVYRRRREQPHSGSNTTQLQFYLGFKLDGANTYLNISNVPHLQAYSTLRVHQGPVILPRDTPIKYKDLRDGPLYINGSRMSQGVQMTDYMVTIGHVPCVILELTDRHLACQPPQEAPNIDPEDPSDYPVIKVYIGSNTEILYGSLKYPLTVWIIVGPVLGILVVIFAILIALLVLRRRIRNRNKHRKQEKKYHYSPGEMIKLPAVKRADFDEAFRIPGDGSGSLLVFHHDPSLCKGSPSQSRTSSALTTSVDEFDPPEEFYENKETIKRQQSHEAALEQFTGNSSGLRYTAEPQNSPLPEQSTSRKSDALLPSASKPKAKNPELETFTRHQNSYPSLRSFESGSGAGPSSKQHQPQPVTQEDIYVNNNVDGAPNQGKDIYENSMVQTTAPKKKKKKDKGPHTRRDPALLPDVPITLPQPASSIPPPVPDTPRPKLNITPKHRRTTTNGQQPAAYKHHSLSSRPFEENPYTNARTGDSDDDDIYVNSPIKSRGLRTSGRGPRGRGTQRRRYEVDRGATLWY